MHIFYTSVYVYIYNYTYMQIIYLHTHINLIYACLAPTSISLKLETKWGVTASIDDSEMFDQNGP